MSGIAKIKKWGDLHHPKILDIIRILLGLFLVTRGIIFFNNSAYLRELLIENNVIRQSPKITMVFIYYVTYIHLVGGFFIFIGFFTRMAALFELPIFAGSLFFVHVLSSYVNAEFWLYILVLAQLLLFVVIGSGPISFDHILAKIKTEDE